MKYETCMKYKCKNCPAYYDCSNVEKLQEELRLLYKPFENLDQILKSRRKKYGKTNQSN